MPFPPQAGVLGEGAIDVAPSTGMAVQLGRPSALRRYVAPSAQYRYNPPSFVFFLFLETCKISQIFKFTPNLVIQISGDSINHGLRFGATCTFF